jgi:hypothetical protein
MSLDAMGSGMMRRVGARDAKPACDELPLEGYGHG